VLKAGMESARVDKVGKSELLDVPQTLEVRMRNNIEDQLTFDVNKAVERIINDFLFVQSA